MTKIAMSPSMNFSLMKATNVTPIRQKLYHLIQLQHQNQQNLQMVRGRTHFQSYHNWTLTIDTGKIGSVRNKSTGYLTLFTFNTWHNSPWNNWTCWNLIEVGERVCLFTKKRYQIWHKYYLRSNLKVAFLKRYHTNLVLAPM